MKNTKGNTEPSAQQTFAEGTAPQAFDAQDTVLLRNFSKEETKEALTASQKKFRTFLGGAVLLVFVAYLVFSPSSSLAIDSVQAGAVQNIQPGATLDAGSAIVSASDYTVTVQEGGDVQLSVWDYLGSNGGYVQIYVDGRPLTNAFMVSNHVVKVSVPAKGLIQVRGISPGSNGMIQYAVFFNKTGETYFNTVPLNGENVYTVKTAV